MLASRAASLIIPDRIRLARYGLSVGDVNVLTESGGCVQPEPQP